MILAEEIKESIFKISNEADFEKLSLQSFLYQSDMNPVYSQMISLLGVQPGLIDRLERIPFIPVGFFRDHKVISGEDTGGMRVFTSSGTTGSIPSRHYVADLELYEQSFIKAFTRFYGRPEGYRFLALLPGYLERQGSSLVYMMDFLIRMTLQNGSGFYLHDFRSLSDRLRDKEQPGTRTILFGASYALLDFSEHFPMDLKDVIVMETGGMKGRKREMIREELHEILAARLNVPRVHSEYGMTELLSQAYSEGHGIFRAPPWMKIIIRDPNDPMHFLPPGQVGGINVIDLANVNSCSFIATQDLGKVHDDGSFEVIGRFDDSDIRGCNLLVA